MVPYNGDADSTCDWLCVQQVANETNAPGYSSAGFADISTTEGEINGVVKQASNLAFVRVYNAGHQAAFYQPLLALEVFNRTIHGLDVETGKIKVVRDDCESGYSTQGPEQSVFRQGSALVKEDCPAGDGENY